MGREIKRVPTDFDHPVGEIWPGYEPPDVRDCPDCHKGATDARDVIEAVMLKLLGFAKRIGKRGLGHHAEGLVISNPHTRELEDEFAKFTEGLSGRPPRGLGHDAIDRHKATKAVIEAAGLDPEEWGICNNCDGKAIHPDDQGKRESWERTDPPSGEGFQVWETVSEGAPITPVCETAEEMVDYLTEHGTEWDDPWSRESAESFLDSEWAPSFIASEKGVQKGYDAV